MSSSRFSPPDPGFLPEICVDTDYTTNGWPVVTLFHPHAHSRNDVVGTAMLAIAGQLRLNYGHRFPRTGQYIYDINGYWALDYGHPRDLLHFAPDPVWAQVARRGGGALVAVSLEHEPHPAAEVRILTGRLALRQHTPPEWVRAR